MAARGHKSARPKNCHVRALLDPLRGAMDKGDVSLAIAILKEIRANEASNCHYLGNKACAQFCKSSKNLDPVITKMKRTCNFLPLIKLIEESVKPVAKSVS